MERNTEYINFDIKEIVEVMKDFIKQKASGPDEISTWISNECAGKLCEPTQMIFQSSVNQGKLLDVFKKAKVVPLYRMVIVFTELLTSNSNDCCLQGNLKTYRIEKSWSIKLL